MTLQEQKNYHLMVIKQSYKKYEPY